MVAKTQLRWQADYLLFVMSVLIKSMEWHEYRKVFAVKYRLPFFSLDIPVLGIQVTVPPSWASVEQKSIQMVWLAAMVQVTKQRLSIVWGDKALINSDICKAADLLCMVNSGMQWFLAFLVV